MDSLSVTESLPKSYKRVFVPGLYNSHNYLAANNGLPQLHFYLLNEANQTVEGHIAFSMEEGEATSPFRAPFAGFELAPELDHLSFLFFLQEVQRKLKEKGVRYLKLQLAPGCYQPLSQVMAVNLHHMGFEEKGRWVNHAIPVNEQPLLGQIASMEKRRLRKVVKAPLSFRFAERSEFSSFFIFIKQHREAKGHRLSMEWDDLKQAMKASPENYLAAGVYQEEQLIGASILIKVSAQVVYNFFPANDTAFNSWSPMVFLLDSVYRWCQKEGIQWIDLGTSYLGTTENKTLRVFKEHMGGKPFESVIFRKTLSS